MLRAVETSPSFAIGDRGLPDELERASGLVVELGSQLRAIKHEIEAATQRREEVTVISRPSVLITAEEAAESLRVSRTVVYGLMRNGDLRSVKIGSSRRIPIGALDEYVASLPA